MLTSLKGVASTKLARDLGISQKSAWHLGHRIRAALTTRRNRLLLGPVEIEETYIGGKARNRHASKRDGKRGVAGKRAVVGILDRATGEVRAEAIEDTRKDELQGYLEENVSPAATIYSDQSPSYADVPNPHVAVLHSAGEYVHQQAHINGIEFVRFSVYVTANQSVDLRQGQASPPTVKERRHESTRHTENQAIAHLG